MKRKAINASLRKESQTFEGWLKYEVEIQNEDGTTEMVPAYGKDLQDALSRVVHDERVVKLEKRAKRIPDVVWVMLWFGYMLGWTMLSINTAGESNLNGLVFISGFVIVTGLVIGAKTWFRRRNISK
jgi:hypothetical protein